MATTDNKLLGGAGLSHLASVIKTALADKQDTLTAGDCLNISGAVISATSCPYTTVEPTAASSNGLGIAYLQSEPTTKYAGWLYLIAEQ